MKYKQLVAFFRITLPQKFRDALFLEYVKGFLQAFSERNFSINFTDIKDRFHDYPPFKFLSIFVISINSLVRLISYTSIRVQKSMKEISIYSKSLSMGAQNIQETVKQTNNISQKLIGIYEGSSFELESMQIKSMELSSLGFLISNNSEQFESFLKAGITNLTEADEGIKNLIHHNNDINNSIRELWQNFNSLSFVVQELMKISEQTSLLALNAEIEAEHAGEHGKGFAIVALEMGKLSKKSTETARTIVDGFKKLQETSKKTVKKASDSLESANTTKDAFLKADNSYRETKNLSLNLLSNSNKIKTISENFESNVVALEENFKNSKSDLKNFEMLLKKIEQYSATQVEDSNKIKDLVITNYINSTMINSLISQIAIRGFKEELPKQTRVQEIIERVMKYRGIIVSMVYMDNIALRIEEEKELFKIDDELTTVYFKSGEEGMSSIFYDCQEIWIDIHKNGQLLIELIANEDRKNTKEIYENTLRPLMKKIIDSLFIYLTREVI